MSVALLPAVSESTSLKAALIARAKAEGFDAAGVTLPEAIGQAGERLGAFLREAMHGDMGGYYEIRLTGPGRRQYRLFCILDNGSPKELRKRGFEQPQIAAITGMVKDSGKKFSNRDYAKVRELGAEYLGELPRRIAV